MTRTQRVDVVGQGEAGAPQPQGQAIDLRNPVFDHALLARQRYLSLPEAADYLRFPTPEAFWHWAKRQGVRPCKAGHTNLYLRTDLEAHVERSRKADPHAPPRPRLVTRTRGARHDAEPTGKSPRTLPDGPSAVSGRTR